MSAPWRVRALDVTYRWAVALVGWGGLLVCALFAPESVPWLPVVLFVALSLAVKRLGYEVVPGVRHSLVGVIDLAAFLSLGRLGGLLVAALSGALCQLMQWRAWPRFASSLGIGVPVARAAFTSGLNILMMLGASAAYRVLGGAVPLAQVTWAQFLPLLAASLTWFLGDHLGWFLNEFLARGIPGGRAFLRAALPYSLLIELAPLPIAALLSTAYLSLNSLTLLLLGLLVVGIGYGLRQLLVSLTEERRHVRELTALGSLGQTLLSPGLSLAQICESVYLHCQDLIASPVFALQLWDAERAAPVVALAVADGRRVPEADTVAGAGAYSYLATTHQALRVDDLAVQMSAFEPLHIGATARSGLYVPILLKDELLGVISLQSAAPRAYSAQNQETLALIASQAALGLHAARLYQRERQRTAQLMAVAEVSRSVAAVLDLRTLFADTVRLVRATFGYYHVSVFTVDAERQQVHFQAGSDAHLQEQGVNLAWGQGLVGQAAASGRIQLARDVSSDERFLPDSLLDQTRSELAMPLVVEQRILGVLDMQSDRLNAFGESEIAVLQTLADQVAIAIEDSRLYERQQEQAWISTALLQVADAVAQHTAPEEMLETVARLTVMLAGVDQCIVFLWSEEDQLFTAVESAGMAREQAQALKHQSFALDAVPLLQRVKTEGETDRGRLEDLARFLPPPVDEGARRGDVLAMPLRSKGEIIGVLVAAQLEGRTPINNHREALLAGIANHAAMGLDNTRLYASQREEAWVSTALLQVATMIGTSRDLEEIVSTVVRLTSLLAGVPWCAILLWDEARHAFFATRSYGLPKDQRELFEGQYFGSGTVPLLDALFSSREPITVRRASDTNLLSEAVADTYREGALTVLPLQGRARLLGALLVGQLEGHRTPLGRRLSILAGIANQTAFAIETAELYQRTVEQERLAQAMELARNIQESFLPECCPELPGWQLSVEWRAARGVGGDYYDFVHLDSDHLGLVIADVSDKGVAAALYMALSRAVMRASTIGTHSPAESLRRANRILLEDARSGMFVSMFYGVLTLSDGTLTYARAGHNPPLLLHARDDQGGDGECELQTLDAPGTVLGILEDPQLCEARVQLTPGDVLVMYTDGVTEAVDDSDQEFGEERLRQVVAKVAECGAEEVVARIAAAVRMFTGECPQFDDFTLMVVMRDDQRRESVL